MEASNTSPALGENAAMRSGRGSENSVEESNGSSNYFEKERQGYSSKESSPAHNSTQARARREREALAAKNSTDDLISKNTMYERAINQIADERGVEASELIEAYSGGDDPDGDEQLGVAIAGFLGKLINSYRARDIEWTIAQDIAAVNAAFPEVGLKSMDDLGGQFMALRAAGITDPVLCWCAAREVAKQKKKPSPGSPGSMFSSVDTSGGEFFTPQEVDSMSREQVKKHYDKIIKSQKQWRKNRV